MAHAPESAAARYMALVQYLETLSQAGISHLGLPPDKGAGTSAAVILGSLETAASGLAPRVPSVAKPGPAGPAFKVPQPAAPAPLPAQTSAPLPSKTSAPLPSQPVQTPSQRPISTQMATAALPPHPVSVPAPLHSQAGDDPHVPKLSRNEKQKRLTALKEEVSGCVRCPVLVSYRAQTVFGVGNPDAQLCFFGEAPGADEDRLGEPFVGRAGQLLDKMIAAMGLKRQDVYICNVLRCRPPDNRTPLPGEMENCRLHFERELQYVQPKFICCLGSTATRALLQTETPVGKLRGRFHDYRGAKVVCTYHPAYLLRNPPAKKEVWIDLQMLMKEMGLPIPTTGPT